MSVFRCKMCGGNLEVADEKTVCICEFCGTRQTIPTRRDEALQALYNRANALRIKAEFDKAAELYEKALLKNEKDPEAYWGLVLCKYGIEYVEDPASFKRIPTCHRVSYDAALADEDFRSAIQYADSIQREIYEEQAREIDRIQKEIIELARQEEPYDVFICYKETDENGKRTHDSVYGNDIFYLLKQEGYRVFFSAISLEDKVGQEYEPYIFSALNSAKVMLVLGSKPEYYSSPWVKNEWSRFLKTMRRDRSKLLIPCYRDMDPYDLPEEFSHLQAQDMSRLGFMQDLIRGIKKIIGEENITKAPVAAQSSEHTPNNNNGALLKRGKMALEDKDWAKAYDFYEEVLNSDPECSEAYIGQFLAGRKASSLDRVIFIMAIEHMDELEQETIVAGKSDTNHIRSMVKEYCIPGYLESLEIKKCYEYDFSYKHYSGEAILSEKAAFRQEVFTDKYISKALKFASEAEKADLEAIIAKQLKAFDDMIEKSEKQTQEEPDRIMASYEEFQNGADEKVKELHDNACKKRESDYNKTASLIEKSSDPNKLREIINLLESFKGYKDSEKLIDVVKNKLRKIDEERALVIQKIEEQEHKKRIKRGIVIAIVVILLFVLGIMGNQSRKKNNYQLAVQYIEEGNYDQARELFEKLGAYEESETYLRLLKIIDEANEMENGTNVSSLIRSLRIYSSIFDVDSFIIQNEQLKFVASLEGEWHGEVGFCDERYPEEFDCVVVIGGGLESDDRSFDLYYHNGLWRTSASLHSGYRVSFDSSEGVLHMVSYESYIDRSRRYNLIRR